MAFITPYHIIYSDTKDDVRTQTFADALLKNDATLDANGDMSIVYCENYEEHAAYCKPQDVAHQFSNWVIAMAITLDDDNNYVSNQPNKPDNYTSKLRSYGEYWNQIDMKVKLFLDKLLDVKDNNGNKLDLARATNDQIINAWVYKKPTWNKEFENMLPDIRTNKDENQIWYKLKSFDPQIYKGGSLRGLVDAIVTKKLTFPRTSTLEQADTFNIGVDKSLMHALMRLKKTGVMEPTTRLADDTFEPADQCLDFSGAFQWYRNANGEYVLRRDDKDEVIDASNPGAFRAFLNKHCQASGFNDTTSCENFMNHCIKSNRSDGLSICVQYLKFFNLNINLLKAEIKNMHPIVAYQILKRFGFKKRTQFDLSAGANLQKVESVAHWKKRMSHELDKLAEETITSGANSGANLAIDDNIMQYLALVVSYVNCNPGILNRHYSGLTDEQQGETPLCDFSRKLGIKHRKEPVQFGYNKLMEYLKSSWLHLPKAKPGCGSPWSSTPGLYSAPLGSIYGSGSSTLIGGGKPEEEGQEGGSLVYQSGIRGFDVTLDGKPYRASALAEELFNQLKGQLKADIQRQPRVANLLQDCGTLLQKLKKNENTLAKNLALLDAFNKKLTIFRGHPSSNVLNPNTLTQFDLRGSNIMGHIYDDTYMCAQLLMELERAIDGDLSNL